MKIKNLKKKIETVLLKRVYESNKYIILSSSIKNSLPKSYNIINYSLKYSLQKTLTKPLVNNFLKLSFFDNAQNFNLFITSFKTNLSFIYFIKFKNLYFFNFDSDFKVLSLNVFNIMTRLQKLFFNWLFFFKVIVKKYIE